MSYEWHSKFNLEDHWSRFKGEAKERLEQDRRSTRDRDVLSRLSHELTEDEVFDPVTDLQAAVSLLAQSVGDTREVSWNIEAKRVYTEMLTHDGYDDYAKRNLDRWGNLGFQTPRLNLSEVGDLQTFSFFAYVPFTLSAPYISKDDAPFYVHDNPLRKDPVLKVPMVSPTGWKGAFRAALRYNLQVSDEATQVVRLLGNAKGSQKDFCRGRLVFFPTFFSELGVGVINPHSRETGAGQKPIHIEEVPRGAEGAFALLYIPLYLPELSGSGIQTAREEWITVVEDEIAVLHAVLTMLIDLGFGAKTASGMGKAEQGMPKSGYLLLPTGKKKGTPDERLIKIPIHENLDRLSLLAKELEQQLTEGGCHG